MQVELFSHGEESHSFASVSHLQENNRGKLVKVSTFIAVTAETCYQPLGDVMAQCFPISRNCCLWWRQLSACLGLCNALDFRVPSLSAGPSKEQKKLFTLCIFLTSGSC